MIRRACPILIVLVLVAPLAADLPRSSVYSTPGLPSDAVLRRLNLHLAWRTAVPMDGRRDGFLVVDVQGRDVIVLTRSGMVARLDAESGEMRWKARVGKPYTLVPHYGANRRSVYVGANAVLYALDREVGAEKWEYRLRAGISAAPVVDDEQIYVPTATTRLYAYALPFVGVLASPDSPGGASPIYTPEVLRSESRPRPTWEEQTNIQLAYRPLLTSDVIFVASPSGRSVAYGKVAQEYVPATLELYRFETDGKISVPPGQFGDTAYIGSDDSSLYAVNLGTGKLRWRHTAGTRVTQRPIALEKDVFVTSRAEGMGRLDRDTGEAMWRVPVGKILIATNRNADLFLAANQKFVYARDGSDRLLILDRKRGVTLSTLDATAFRFPVVNETTDRLYLASNDGTILCLHDRDVPEPIRHRKVLEDAFSPAVRQLEMKVDEREDKLQPLRDALRKLELKHKLTFKFKVAEEAFKKAGIENVNEKPVKIPFADKKPLKDVLTQMLKDKEVNGTFRVVGDAVVLILPKGK